MLDFFVQKKNMKEAILLSYKHALYPGLSWNAFKDLLTGYIECVTL